MKRCLENVQGVLLGAMFFFLGLSLLAMPQNRLLADAPGGGGQNVPQCTNGTACKESGGTCKLKPKEQRGCVTQNTNQGCNSNPSDCELCFCRYSETVDENENVICQSCDCRQ